MLAVNCILVFIMFASGGHGQQTPTEDYEHHAVLDVGEKVQLYWNFDDTHITFEVHAQTTGWIGIGISPSGSMAGADMHVGWVKNGRAKITDRHRTQVDDNGFPALDTEQNVELIDGRECDGWTIIKFRRQLAACNRDEDLEINSDTVKLIWAYGSTDPDGNDITASNYHATNRGVKSMLMLDPAGSDQALFPEGESHLRFDLTNDKFALPAVDTYYNCRLHKLPEMSSKQHLVKIEPIIQPGNEYHLHHMLVYSCDVKITALENVGENAECFSSNMPQEFNSCTFLLHAWAIGGGTFHYPKHVGYPLGTEDAPKYVLVETHYDNPTIEAGVVDSSGLRFTYTSQLREYDAGMMEVGHNVGGFHHVIPPNAESYFSTAECSSDCTQWAMKSEERSELKMFAVQLHSHLLGQGMTLKHVRNGVELAPLASDQAYDFNFQETRHLPEERSLLPGDAMQMVCNYRSKNVRSRITLGGLSTQEEMCVSFVYYYPKIDTSFCFNAPHLPVILSYFGITDYDQPQYILGNFQQNLYNVNVTAPAEYAGRSAADVINEWPWNEETADLFAEAMTNATKFQICGGLNAIMPAPILSGPLEIKERFIGEIQNCTEPSEGMATTGDSGVCSVETTPPLVETTSGVTVVGSSSLMYFCPMVLTGFLWRQTLNIF